MGTDAQTQLPQQDEETTKIKLTATSDGWCCWLPWAAESKGEKNQYFKLKKKV
jgi:hypothetical protein